jgi:hypothetical protein
MSQFKSISLTNLEELRLNYSKLTRLSVANFDNDATACYDRILCAVASLAGRKYYGIHKDIHEQTLTALRLYYAASGIVFWGYIFWGAYLPKKSDILPPF